MQDKPRDDPRPQLAAKLSLLTTNPQWVTWRDNRRLKLRAIEPHEHLDHRMAVIVSRGRFGLGRIIERDGLRALDIHWLLRARSTASLHLRRADVRAIVVEMHSRANPRASA